jgi:hypothetical protein|tara:strand:- start:6377 stop:6616 length:240 start_codon:yes stop_codon:yes gene_type:complete
MMMVHILQKQNSYDNYLLTSIFRKKAFREGQVLLDFIQEALNNIKVIEDVSVQDWIQKKEFLIMNQGITIFERNCLQSL